MKESKNNNKRTGNKRPNKKKFYGKEDGRDSKRFAEGNTEDRSEYKSALNDVTFYAKDAQLLKDAASFAYSNPLGTSYKLFPGGTTWEPFNNYSIPGVCALVVRPTIGITKDWVDPINVASRRLYSFVRHANSGHSNYDAPDLMMYIIAMANLHGLIRWAQRVYGTCMTYAYRNRYFPRALVEAQGIDFDDFMEHIADYRARLNILTAKIASLAVPADLGYYKRLAFMFSGYYFDENTPKAQTYMYVPDGYYQIQRNSETQATELTYIRLSSNTEPGDLPDRKSVV